MLLLYRRSLFSGFSLFPLIYIPLCFYFIHASNRRKRKLVPFTFHYASTLSQFWHPWRMSCRIYIPLCFYFIYPKHPYISFFCRIYIPLCFYFIAAGDFKSKGILQIYIPLCFYFIESFFNFFRWNSNLHSTMLLLYRLSVGALGWFYFNLHSTMLLLYRRRKGVEMKHINNLHSTMLLLYPDRGRGRDPVRVHLHSTMLLLYPWLLWISSDG